jgi:chemotaxis protein histidine kinase CheA
MKTIKFDLKLNNGAITLCTLDDLKNNLSPELFEHFHSGKLAKWLRVRKLEEQADAVEKLLAKIHNCEAQSLKGLIELFGGEADVDSLRTAIAERKKALPSSRQNSDDEVERLKAENEALKTEIEELKNPPKSKTAEEQQFIKWKLCELQGGFRTRPYIFR